MMGIENRRYPQQSHHRRMSSDFGDSSIIAPVNRRSEPSIKSMANTNNTRSNIPTNTNYDRRNPQHLSSSYQQNHHQQHQQQQMRANNGREMQLRDRGGGGGGGGLQHQNRLLSSQRSMSSNSLFDSPGAMTNQNYMRNSQSQHQGLGAGRESPSMRSVSSMEDLRQNYLQNHRQQHQQQQQRGRNYPSNIPTDQPQLKNIRRSSSSGSLLQQQNVGGFAGEKRFGPSPSSPNFRQVPTPSSKVSLPHSINNKEKIDNYLSSLGQQRQSHTPSIAQASQNNDRDRGKPSSQINGGNSRINGHDYDRDLGQADTGGRSFYGSVAGGSVVNNSQKIVNGSIANSKIGGGSKLSQARRNSIISNISKLTGMDKCSITSKSNTLNYKESFPLPLSFYLKAKETWPETGNHLLATYNSTAIILYLATNAGIARQTVINQNFKSNYEEIDWILTPSFMNIVQFSGWATREEHDNILALTVDRQGFEELFKEAINIELEARGSKKMNSSSKDLNEDVHEGQPLWLEWQNETDPFGMKLTRSAPYLHIMCHRDLKNYHVLKFISEMVAEIDDVTGFIRRQRKTFLAWSGGAAQLYVPTTREYTFLDNRLGNQFSLMYLRSPPKSMDSIQSNSLDTTMSIDIEDPIPDNFTSISRQQPNNNNTNNSQRGMNGGGGGLKIGSCLSRISSIPSGSSAITIRGQHNNSKHNNHQESKIDGQTVALYNSMTSNNNPNIRRPMLDMMTNNTGGGSRRNSIACGGHYSNSRTGTIRSRSSGISSLNTTTSRASSQYLH